MVPPALRGAPSKSSIESPPDAAAAADTDRLGGPPAGGILTASGAVAPTSGVTIREGGPDPSTGVLTGEGAMGGIAPDVALLLDPIGGVIPLGGAETPLTFLEGGADIGGGGVAAGVLVGEAAPAFRLTHFLVSGSKKKELSSPSFALWTVGALGSFFPPPNQPAPLNQPDFFVSLGASRC